MKNNRNTLVLGGCKSGKSRHALELAERLSPDRRIYLATCVPLDDEMEDRVKRHQAERDDTWRTLDVPVDVAGAIRDHNGNAGVILLDCLTLWVTNLLMDGLGNDAILEKTHRLMDELDRSACPVVMVSNEVGAGIVPENRLARQFRDVAGMVNQIVAARADRVVVTFAGLSLTLKGAPL